MSLPRAGTQVSHFPHRGCGPLHSLLHHEKGISIQCVAGEAGSWILMLRIIRSQKGTVKDPPGWWS